MSIDRKLHTRSESKCELCASEEKLSVYEVPASTASGEEAAILVCEKCLSQINAPETMDSNHWRCLNDSMWSPVPAVQIMAYRLLNRLKAEGWPQDLLDMLYFEEDMLAWAQAEGDGVEEDEDAVKHIDSNGSVLQAGDNVVLIKDLNVKGGGFTAKRGTAVRGISLVHDNPEQIEGRVNGQHIVLLCKFVKKM